MDILTHLNEARNLAMNLQSNFTNAQPEDLIKNNQGGNTNVTVKVSTGNLIPLNNNKSPNSSKNTTANLNNNQTQNNSQKLTQAEILKLQLEDCKTLLANQLNKQNSDPIKLIYTLTVFQDEDAKRNLESNLIIKSQDVINQLFSNSLSQQSVLSQVNLNNQSIGSISSSPNPQLQQKSSNKTMTQNNIDSRLQCNSSLLSAQFVDLMINRGDANQSTVSLAHNLNKQNKSMYMSKDSITVYSEYFSKLYRNRKKSAATLSLVPPPKRVLQEDFENSYDDEIESSTNSGSIKKGATGLTNRQQRDDNLLKEFRGDYIVVTNIYFKNNSEYLGKQQAQVTIVPDMEKLIDDNIFIGDIPNNDNTIDPQPFSINDQKAQNSDQQVGDNDFFDFKDFVSPESSLNYDGQDQSQDNDYSIWNPQSSRAGGVINNANSNSNGINYPPKSLNPNLVFPGLSPYVVNWQRQQIVNVAENDSVKILFPFQRYYDDPRMNITIIFNDKIVYIKVIPIAQNNTNNNNNQNQNGGGGNTNNNNQNTNDFSNLEPNQNQQKPDDGIKFPGDNTNPEDQLNQNLTAFISNANIYGLVQIKFSQVIKQITPQEAKDSIKVTLFYQKVDYLENYEVVSVNDQNLILQLFKKPPNDKTEENLAYFKQYKLVVYFANQSAFVSQVNMKTLQTPYLVYLLKYIINEQDTHDYQNLAQSYTLTTATSVLSSLMISSSISVGLQYLWSFLNTIQILAFMPLIGLKMPDFLIVFFENINKFNYAIIDMSDFIANTLDLDDSSQVTRSQDFDIVGMESMNIFINCTDFFVAVFILAIAKVGLYIIIKKKIDKMKESNWVSKIILRIDNILGWAFFLRVLNQSFLSVMIGAILNLYVLNLKSFGEGLSSVVSLALVIGGIGYLIFTFIILTKFKQNLKDQGNLFFIYVAYLRPFEKRLQNLVEVFNQLIVFMCLVFAAPLVYTNDHYQSVLNFDQENEIIKVSSYLLISMFGLLGFINISLQIFYTTKYFVEQIQNYKLRKSQKTKIQPESSQLHTTRARKKHIKLRKQKSLPSEFDIEHNNSSENQNNSDEINEQFELDSQSPIIGGSAEQIHKLNSSIITHINSIQFESFLRQDTSTELVQKDHQGGNDILNLGDLIGNQKLKILVNNFLNCQQESQEDIQNQNEGEQSSKIRFPIHNQNSDPQTQNMQNNPEDQTGSNKNNPFLHYQQIDSNDYTPSLNNYDVSDQLLQNNSTTTHKDRVDLEQPVIPSVSEFQMFQQQAEQEQSTQLPQISYSNQQTQSSTTKKSSKKRKIVKKKNIKFAQPQTGNNGATVKSNSLNQIAKIYQKDKINTAVAGDKQSQNVINEEKVKSKIKLPPIRKGSKPRNISNYTELI
eukprot:403349091